MESISGLIERLMPEVNAKSSVELGDRSQYVGSSDVVGCPRRKVYEKLYPTEYDTQTLLRFERGHMTEDILEPVLKKAGIEYKRQVEIIRPDEPMFQAHVDYLLKDAKGYHVLEVKSSTYIPTEPYESWEAQLQWQLNALHEQYPKITSATGSVLAMDLGRGAHHEYDSVEADKESLVPLLENAYEIKKGLETGDYQSLNCVTDNFCDSCPVRKSCPIMVKHADGYLDIEDKDLESLVNKLQEIKGLVKESRGIEEEIKQSLPHNKIKLGRYLVSLSKRTRQSLQSKELKEKLPQIYEEFTKSSEYNTLQIKKEV